MPVHTTRRTVLIRAHSLPTCSARAPQNEARQNPTRLGYRSIRNSCGFDRRLLTLRSPHPTGSARWQRHRPYFWHPRLWSHDFCRIAGRAKTSPHIAARPRTNVDARRLVARGSEPTADSVSRRISLRRDAYARADVAADYHCCQRGFWRGAATFFVTYQDVGCSPGNEIRLNPPCAASLARRSRSRHGFAVRLTPDRRFGLRTRLTGWWLHRSSPLGCGGWGRKLWLCRCCCCGDSSIERNGKRPAARFLSEGNAAVPRKTKKSCLSPERHRQSANRVFQLANAASGPGTRHSR